LKNNITRNTEKNTRALYIYTNTRFVKGKQMVQLLEYLVKYVCLCRHN